MTAGITAGLFADFGPGGKQFVSLLGATVYAAVGADGQLRVRLTLGIGVVQVFGDGPAQVDYFLDTAVSGVIS